MATPKEKKQCPECGKLFSNLTAHQRLAHTSQDEPTPPVSGYGQEQGPPLLDGLSPELIQGLLQQYVSPIIREEVGKASTTLMQEQANLVRMQVRAELDQIAAEVQSRSTQGQSTANPTEEQPSSSGRQPQSNPMINMLAQALIQNLNKPQDTLNLEPLLKQQVALSQLSDALNKPYRDLEESFYRRIQALLSIGHRAGLSPQETMERMEQIDKQR